jgi:hypothetical protein
MIPSQGYLANVWSAASPATTSTTPIGPTAPGPLPANLFGLPGTPAPIQLPQEMPPPLPPPPPDPHLDEARGMSVMPAPAPVSTQGPPPAPPAAPPPPVVAPPAGARSGGNEYPLRAVPGGGFIPEHEFDRRGPSLKGAQGVRNLASEMTIDQVRGRNEDMAQQEQAMYLDQERQARAREAAMQQSFAERDEEMAQRQADFDGTVKQLGKMGTIDRDRFWASRSTGQKIAGFIEMALSGFNRAPSMVLKRIDDDVKAQEFAYHATRDTAQAKQTAYSMAMQKYQNADAARAMARAASIDTVQAQFAQMGAKWKGTEAANRADMASAALQDEKMMQIANGIQFIPAQSVGRRFYDPRTGLTYSEAEAKAMSGKVDERDFENRKQVAGIGGQLAVEEAKAQNELVKAQSGKADEGAHQISTQLQQAGVPMARVAAEEALAALNASRGGRLEAAARKVLPGSSSNVILSDAANEREQKYQAFANAAMKAMMGNVTANELDRAEKALGSASDPASRERAIKSTLATLEEIEKNAKAGASPAAQAEFDRRRENAKGDKPAAPPSAAKGW